MDHAKDLYALAQAEIDEIDQKLKALRASQIPLESRRNDLVQFLSLGRRLFEQPDAHSQEPSMVGRVRTHDSAPVGVLSTAGGTSMKARVLSMCRQILSKKPYAHTVELVYILEANGVAITGKDKNTTVSVILSRSDEFVSDRTRGWSLTQKETPQDAPTSAGSSAA
jgi:hypothetical protein